jgi:RHS repeat-associated protein
VRTCPLALLLAAVMVLSGSVAIEAVAAPDNAIRYVYDDVGRLKAVVDPATETGVYRWDVVGNLLSAARRPSNSVQVLQVSPGSGPVGTSVRIIGTGFGATAGQNTVRFNGTSATVTSASASELVAVVPAGATTGPVSVTSPTGSATSDSPFTVSPAAAPVINTAAPAVAAPGTAVTLGGQNFGIRLADNSVTLNNSRVELTSASATALGITVPEATGSGRVRVSTAEGTAVGPDLFVPPSGIVPADVQSTGRMAVGDTTTVSIGTAGKVGLVAFEGTAGQRVSLQPISNSFGNGFCVSLLGTDNSTLGSACSNTFLEPVTLPTTGTYSVLVRPSVATGSLTFKLWDVPGDAAYTASPSAAGDTTTVANTVPGQNGKVTFSGTAGQRISVNASPTSYTPTGSASVAIKKPDGSELYFTTGSFIDTVTLPVSGTYTIVVDPNAAGVGTTTLTIWDVPPDATDSVTPTAAGVSRTLTTTVPTQNAKLTFEGTAGRRILVHVDNSTYPTWNGSIDLRRPDGGSLNANSLKSGSFLDTVTLPSTGAYTVDVNPFHTNTGSVTLSIYDVPPDTTASVTPSPAGTQVIVDTSPGQSGAVTFSGATGQRISYNITAKSYAAATFVNVRKPDGSVLVGQSVSSAPYFQDSFTLPSTGTYTISVDPSANGGGELAMTVYDVPADTVDTIGFSAAGETKTVTTTVGQNGQLTFEGSQGQKASVRMDSIGYPAARVSLRNPDGTNLSNVQVTNPVTLATSTLPSTGTYTISVDPQGAAAGNLSIRLTDVTGSSMARMSRVGAARASRAGASEAPRPGRDLAGSPVWLPRLAEQAGLRVPTRREITLRPSAVARLEVMIPAGTVLRDSDGRRVNRLRVDRLSAARAPRPLPPGVKLSGLLSFHPLGVSLTRSALLLYPNTANSRPGRRLYLWSYDARERKWSVYGRGTVTADGLQVLPDPNARLSTLTTTAISTSPSPHRRRHASRSTRRERLTARKRVRPASAAERTGSRSLLEGFQPQASNIWRPGRRNRTGAWRTGRPESPWSSLPALRAEEGATALAGQALKLDGAPLAGVTISVEHGDGSTRTDRTGRFLLSGLSAGRHVLVIDGGTAGQGEVRYGLFEVGVDVVRDRTTALEYPIWMTALDRAGDATVDSPTKEATVLRTPRIPGLEVRIPAGSVIRSRHGDVVRKLNLTQVPVDRPPFPLPPFSEVPTYFTLQPGGAYLSKGAQVIYPNYTNLPPGQRTDFWQYDPDDRGWYVYGRGTVTNDGKQVMPDPGVRLWEFTGAMFSDTPMPPDPAPTPAPGPDDGDPVDLSTGLFVYRKTDLAVRDTISAVARRTYRQGDGNSYAFGIGTTMDYDLRLWTSTPGEYQQVDLVLPDGARVHYVRTSDGDGYSNAVFEAQTSPGRFYKSTITFVNNQWDLRLKDGTIYHFPQYGGLQWIKDRYGNKLTITHTQGPTGNVTQVTTPHGRWLKFTSDGSNRITQVRDNGGRTVTYGYDTSGRLASVTDPKGGITRYLYNAAGQMTQITDARNIIYLKNSYDANGRVSTQTLPDGGVYQFAYLDAQGKVTKTTVTDPRSGKREVTFNSKGYATSEKRAVGTALEQTVTYERDPGSNLLLSATDAVGRQTRFGYDPAGNLTTLTRLAGTPNASATTFGYEPTYNLLTDATDALGHASSFGYDASGELTSIRNGDDEETTLAYANGDGLPTAVTNPLGKTTRFGYTAGDLTSVRDPLGNQTKLFVDSVGRLGAVTDPRGNRKRFDYDDLNQLTKVTDPLGGTTTFAYDANGNVTGITDARSKSQSASYDSMDRVLSWTDPLGKVERYEYDKSGNRTKVTDRKGQVTTYQYDALNRRSFAGFGTTVKAGKASYNSTITYTYDLADRLTQAVDSVAGTFTQAYDGLNKLTSAGGPQGTVTYTYDSIGRRASMTASGQSAATYRYDNANRLTGISRGGDNVAIGYDGAGRRASVTLPNGLTEQYSYDDASRLTAIDYIRSGVTLGDLHYEYDATGRRTALWGTYARTGLPQAVSSATYDAANKLTALNGTALSYDLNGNLTADASGTYSWNPRNELASIGGSSTGSFAYDAFGRRLSRTINGQRRDYLYEGPNVVQERSGGNPTANLLTGLRTDETFARTVGSATSSLLTDALGSTIALSDIFGTNTTSYTYEPFGKTTQTGAASDNTFQYTGRENDGNGLYYYRARYYSPAMQRFISQDPIGLAGGDVNLYAYASNSPVNFTDGSGLTIFEDIGDGFESVYGVGGMVDDAIPDEVSEAAAGVLDGATGGTVSESFGARCWNSKWHSAGVAGGAFASSFGAGGVVFRGIRLAGGSRAGAVLGGGSFSGGFEHALTANGNGGTATLGGTVKGALIGGMTAGLGDGFRGSDARPTPEIPVGIGATGSGIASGLDTTAGRKDGCSTD